MKIIPAGNKILIEPTATQYQKTEGGIEVQNDLDEGIVVEVSNYLQEVYKVGDHVLFPTGAGQSQYYNGKSCLWLNAAKDVESANEVWGIVKDDIVIDKQDSL